MNDGTVNPARIKVPAVANVLVKTGVLVLLAALVCWSLWSFKSAQAILLGGMIAVVGHAYFAWQAFRYQGARNANNAFVAFLRGEAGRFAIVFLGFALIFKLNPQVEAWILLLSFIAFYLLYSVFSYRLIRQI